MSLSVRALAEKRSKVFAILGVSLFSLLIVAGVFAKNGWFPSTDPLTGKKTGWLGKALPKNASSSWNPLAAPLPTPTPQLSKEYIYAGSRLLAVEDANANAAPPADLAVWRPDNGNWYVLGGLGSAQTIQGWGQSGDIPVQGDFDGDGKTDFAVMRPDSASNTSQWFIAYSSTGGSTNFQFGIPGDLKAQADYDGDGKTDPAVYRPSNGTVYILGSSAGFYTVAAGGQSSDKPASADYDGDGKADVALWRNASTSFISIASGTCPPNTSGCTPVTVPFGHAGDTVSSDYDGDGRADYAVFDSGNWYILKSSTNSLYTPSTWGQSGDIPVQNDYDADGKVDTAVWRPSTGTWYIINSSTSGQRIQTWGAAGDIPVPAFYRR